MSGGKRKSTTNQRTSTTQTLNPWSQQQWTDQNNRVRTLLDANPGTAYTGPMVAGLSDLEQKARDMFQSNMGSYDTAFDTAVADINNAGLQSDFGSVADTYMNPYQSMVVDSLRTQSNDALEESLAAARGKALADRAYGGTGNAVMEALTRESAGKNLDSQIANLLYTGYNDARGYYADDIASKERRANNILDLAVQQHGLTMNDIMGLNSMGEVDRGIQQDQYGMDYNEFLRQIEDYYRRVGLEQQQLSMIPMLTNSSGTSSGTTTEKSSPGALGVLGTLASGASMFVPGAQGLGIAGLLSSSMKTAPQYATIEGYS